MWPMDVRTVKTLNPKQNRRFTTRLGIWSRPRYQYNRARLWRILRTCWRLTRTEPSCTTFTNTEKKERKKEDGTRGLE